MPEAVELITTKGVEEGSGSLAPCPPASEAGREISVKGFLAALASELIPTSELLKTAEKEEAPAEEFSEQGPDATTQVRGRKAFGAASFRALEGPLKGARNGAPPGLNTAPNAKAIEHRAFEGAPPGLDTASDAKSRAAAAKMMGPPSVEPEPEGKPKAGGKADVPNAEARPRERAEPAERPKFTTKRVHEEPGNAGDVREETAPERNAQPKEGLRVSGAQEGGRPQGSPVPGSPERIPAGGQAGLARILPWAESLMRGESPSAHRLHLRMDTKHLGPLDLDVKMEKSDVSLNIGVETPVERSSLISGRPDLAHSLADQGFSLKEFGVGARSGGRARREGRRAVKSGVVSGGERNPAEKRLSRWTASGLSLWA